MAITNGPRGNPDEAVPCRSDDIVILVRSKQQ